jgi:Cu/Ag efflux pump CusA
VLNLATFKVAFEFNIHYNSTLKVALEVLMFFTEEQVHYLTSQFMPRLKESSITAMIDVACHGHSILSAAQKYSLTHQSLSKNLISLKELQGKIVTAKGLLPSGYLLKENACAFLMAEMPFTDAKELLTNMCEKLGGRVEHGNEDSEVKFYFKDSVTVIFLNPDDSFQYEWSFEHSNL